MSKSLQITILLPFLWAACGNESHETSKSNELSDTTAIAPDTTSSVDNKGKFSVDGYPVTDDILKTNQITLESGPVKVFDKIWFSNDTLDQILIYEVHTDMFRMRTIHFLETDIPKALIGNMSLHKTDGSYAPLTLKLKHFQGLLEQAKQIPSSYFTTNKGFQLGATKESVLRVYGDPDTIISEDGIEQYEWRYAGDMYNPHKQLKGRMAQNSFGHQAIMFFRDDKIIVMVLHNEIP